MGAVSYTIPGEYIKGKNIMEGVEMGPDGVVRAADGEEIAFYEGKKVVWERDGFKYSEEEVNRALGFWSIDPKVGGPVTPDWFKRVRSILQDNLSSIPEDPDGFISTPPISGSTDSLQRMIGGIH